jgi:hypothetical protein
MNANARPIVRTIRPQLLVAVVTMLAAASKAHAANPRVDYQPGVQLGKGFEILDDTVRGECVTFGTDAGEGIGATGQEKDYELEEVTDNLQFAEMIDLSVAASYSAVFSKAEAKAEFLKEQKVNQYAATIVATSKVANQPKVATKVKLTDHMSELARKSPADFRQKCGSYYVSAVTTGGELYGYISIETKNVKEKEALSAMFNAKKGLFKASGELDKTLEKEMSSRRMRVKVHELGGTSETVVSPEELMAKFKGFADAISKGAARPYKVSLQSYRTLPNFPALSQLSETERELEMIMTFALQYMSLLEDISYALGHRDQFVMPAGAEPALKALRTDIEKQLAIAETAAHECRKGATCSVPALRNADDLRGQLPLRYRSTCQVTELKLPQGGFELRAQKLERGDGEMKGHNPVITMEASIVPDGTRLSLRATLIMKEDRKDYTTFTGKIDRVVFDTAGNEDLRHCTYDLSKIAPLAGRLEGRGGKDNHDWTPYNGTGLIRAAECLSDTRGDDTGKLGCKRIELVPVQLLFRHAEETFSGAQVLARKRDDDLRRKAMGAAIKMSVKGR